MDPDNYNIEDDEEKTLSSDNESVEDRNRVSAYRCWLKMLRILISPVDGWKNFKRLRLDSQTANSILLYPSLGVATSAKLLSQIFWMDAELKKAFPEAIGLFCSLFFGYFLTLILARSMSPKNERDCMSTDFSKNFVAVAFTTLALFGTLYQMVPILQPVLVFMPLWTIYIISRGVRFLGFTLQYQTRMATILSVFVIGIPIVIGWLFSLATA